MTQELKSKICDFTRRHGAAMPRLHGLSKMVKDMPDGEFFLLLPTHPASTAEQYQYERYLHQLNHPQVKPLDADMQFFGSLFALYNLCTPRTDKPFNIGNPQKMNRTCRFCGGTTKSGAKFDKVAHAIPAALGNKFLKLADECDTCNEYFGTEIEPTLVELLNIPRVFWGIENRNGLPTVKFSDGTMFRSKEYGNLMIVSGKIAEDASGVFSVQLGRGKPIVPQSFYRALSKIALSVIPDEHLPALKKTVKWVRNGESASASLPKIAAAVVMLPPDPSAQITLYIRKASHPKLPHVVCEFRLGCYMYVYALPFSEMDEGDLIGFFEEVDFKKTFRHYAYMPSWTQQDYSEVQEIQITQRMRISPRNKSSSS